MFTNEETNLICIYNTGTREGLIEELIQMRGYLGPEEKELTTLTDSTLEKLRRMNDIEYETLNLFPDFDMETE